MLLASNLTKSTAEAWRRYVSHLMTQNHMNDVYNKLVANMGGHSAIDENTRELIFTLAKIVTEERTLQDIVDREGMVYTTHGDKGQTYIKSRPEYIELQRLRDKKRAYIKALGISSGEAEDPDFA